jgi:hypothetical protein
MADKIVTQRQAVLQAIEEFDLLKRDGFLAKHRFGKAKRYFVVHEGRHYDSKAIYGVAFGNERPDLGLLPNDAFSGGEEQVAKRLRKLGFTVSKLGKEPSNDLRDQQSFLLTWNPAKWTWSALPDVVAATSNGNRVPDRWRCANMQVRAGDRLYLLVQGADARGLIASGWATGSVFLDDHWNAQRVGNGEQVHYVPLEWDCVVPATSDALLDPRSLTSKALEAVHWATQRSGIRIPDAAARELEAAWQNREAVALVLPDLDAVSPAFVPPGMSILKPPRNGHRRAGEGGTGGAPSRRSRASKLIGDHAERIVHRHLCSLKKDSIRHHAAVGETPGYDISYVEDGQLVAVEVKGTVGKAFANFEITEGEMNAAVRHGAAYQVWLVSDVLSTSPQIEIVVDPAKRLSVGTLWAEPVLWRVSREVE